MKKLLVGFDSAWTPNRTGAIVGAVLLPEGTWTELGAPVNADFSEAERRISGWQRDQSPDTTLVLLDQPTVVLNETGQRPVENIVASPVSLRYGGVQPANTQRTEMFGANAPVWRFLQKFGGPVDPRVPAYDVGVIETYPVLAIITLGWTLPDTRPTGRLPKYNPERRQTFSTHDWKHVCTRAAGFIANAGLPSLSAWLTERGELKAPRKSDQDKLDACLCLIVAMQLACSRDCLFVGNLRDGYMVVPHDQNRVKPAALSGRPPHTTTVDAGPHRRFEETQHALPRGRSDFQ
jgi:predicted RNase H-like nuclease